jgi:hypothetical protein
MSNSDNRKVSTDALETLGTIIDERAGRDAIHLAVEPAIAACPLRPGQDVGFMPGGTDVGPCDNPVGIVDPFLKQFLKKGDRFWLVVYPRQITSLRHVWTHPRFPECPMLGIEMKSPSTKEKSEAWLRDFCDHANCPSYERVMAAIEVDQEGSEYGYGGSELDEDCLLFRGSDAHGEIPPEFWDHVKNVTGREPRARAKYFTCGC